MLDHVSIGVRDIAAAKRFYDAALGPLGYRCLSQGEGSLGYGQDAPVFWISATGHPVPADERSGLHICFAAASSAAVDGFHKAALKAGGRDNGKPGVRSDYGASYYAAFAVDPAGYRVEAHFDSAAAAVHDHAPSIPGLVAKGPQADLADKLMLFGQFVGDWEFDAIRYKADGKVLRHKGDWNFRWILDGQAVQDLWVIPTLAERERTGAAADGFGTTVRCFDPKTDSWRVTWNGTVDPISTLLIARREGDEIVLRGQDEAGAPMHWIFSNVTKNRFHWRRVVSRDGGKTWIKQLEMDVRRKQ
ncbi:MAG TPA: VOC family protein [Stellaceae bacterium]|nr:VOC family protein [Stellaceae bacterium]